MNLRTVLLVLWTIVWASIGVCVMLIDWSGRLYMILARVGWARQILFLAGVKVRVVGAENLDLGRHYVVCSNHASQVDIPVLFHTLETNFRFLAKRSLFYIPIFGWSMWIARFVPVDRGSSKKSRHSIDTAAKKIRKGPSLVVFPEGTRTPDGEMKHFKSGAFILGIKAKTPILPVAVRGSYQVVPKDTLRVTPGVVEVIIGKPIETIDLQLVSKESLRKSCESAVRTMLETGESA